MWLCVRVLRSFCVTHIRVAALVCVAAGSLVALSTPTSPATAAPSATVQTAVAIASTPDGNGYWVASSTGAVYPFGDAASYGSMSDHAAQRTHRRHGALSRRQGVLARGQRRRDLRFGDARFRGSAGALRLNQPIVGMTATPDGGGYWLVASDGGIFAYGDATFYGSTGAMRLNRPVVGMAAAPVEGLLAGGERRGIFAYGDATFSARPAPCA